jgi:hypothetical protein
VTSFSLLKAMIWARVRVFTAAGVVARLSVEIGFQFGGGVLSLFLPMRWRSSNSFISTNVAPWVFRTSRACSNNASDRGRPTCGKAQHPDSLALQRTRFKRGEIISLMCVGITGCDIGHASDPAIAASTRAAVSDILSHRASGVLAVADWHNVCGG